MMAGRSLLMWLGMVTVLGSRVTSQGIQNRRIVVTSIVERPYLFPKDKSVPLAAKVQYEGLIVDLLDRLTRHTGHDYHLTLQSSFGTLNNGSWTGMVGQIVDKRADMALGPITETSTRAQFVEFGSHFQTFGRVAIVKQWPKDAISFTSISLDVRLGRLFAPLDDSVWLLSGMAWFVASLVLYIICRINPFEWRRMVKDRKATLREGESFNCANSYWFMLAAIFWQGFMRSPRSMGGRIVVTFWWLYALIFVSMYIASLTNYLQSLPQSNQVVHKYSRITSLDDILENHNVKVGVIQGSATESFLKQAHTSLYSKIWKRIARDNTFVRNLESGIDKVRESTREEPYVVIAESTMAEYFIRQPPCDLYMIRDFPFIGSYAAAYPQNSSLKSEMDIALYKLKESGELSQLEKKWFAGECKGNYMEIPNDQFTVVKYPPFQRVDLASFSGALILLMIGLAAGAVVTLIEMFIFNYFVKEDQDSEHDKHLMTEKPESSQKSEKPITDV